MTDSALGESAVTSPIAGDSETHIGAMSGHIAPNKSQCSSLGSDREENFESYGENDDVGIEADDR